MLLLYFVCKLGVARSYRKLKLFSSTLECFSCGRGGAVHFRCLPSMKRILILQSLVTFCSDSVLMLTPHKGRVLARILVQKGGTFAYSFTYSPY